MLKLLPAALRHGGNFNENDQANSNDKTAAAGIEKEPPGVSCSYTVRPWPAADKIRPMSQTQAWVDVFVLKRFENRAALASFVGTKANGQPQPPQYVARILDAVELAGNGCPSAMVKPNEKEWEQHFLAIHYEVTSLPIVLHCLNRSVLMSEMKKERNLERAIFSFSSLFLNQAYPLWHYDAPKAIEEWPKEFYTSTELFPLQSHSFGPLQLPVPAHPVPFLVSQLLLAHNTALSLNKRKLFLRSLDIEWEIILVLSIYFFSLPFRSL